MSLAFCDGVDDELTSQKWNVLTGVTLGVAGRNGLGLQVENSTGGTNNAAKILASADEHATLTLGFAYKPAVVTTSGTGLGVCGFRSDTNATSHITISQNTDGTLTARRGTGSGTALGTSTLAGPLITAAQWQYVEVKVALHDTTGTVEIRINGTTVLSLTSVDTKNAGTKTVLDSFYLGPITSSTSSHDAVFDDIYLTNGAGSVNTGFLGDVAIETLLPNGNGTTNQWLGSDGNSTDNYLLVDEATPSSTDYTGSAVSADRDLYAMANLSRGSGTIYGAVATAWAGNSDAGAQSIKHVAKSGATTDVGTAVAVTTTYVPLPKVYEVDPNTSAAWTVSNLNSAEFGVQVN